MLGAVAADAEVGRLPRAIKSVPRFLACTSQPWVIESPRKSRSTLPSWARFRNDSMQIHPRPRSRLRNDGGRALAPELKRTDCGQAEQDHERATGAPRRRARVSTWAASSARFAAAVGGSLSGTGTNRFNVYRATALVPVLLGLGQKPLALLFPFA